MNIAVKLLGGHLCLLSIGNCIKECSVRGTASEKYTVEGGSIENDRMDRIDVVEETWKVVY